MTEITEAVERLKAHTLPHLDKRRAGSAAARLDAAAIKTLLSELTRLQEEVKGLEASRKALGYVLLQAGEAARDVPDVPLAATQARLRAIYETAWNGLRKDAAPPSKP